MAAKADIVTPTQEHAWSLSREGNRLVTFLADQVIPESKRKHRGTLKTYLTHVVLKQFLPPLHFYQNPVEGDLHTLVCYLATEHVEIHVDASGKVTTTRIPAGKHR